ncbi:MAG TPA: type II toxin-antitoxin system HipA family toxin [Polyangiales bacterium]
MTAADKLQVLLGTELVGELTPDELGRMTFTYAPEFLARPLRFPISASLPLREQPYAGGPGHAFFANLLPEGGVRTAVCGRFGISVDNDMGLLRAIGGECAGALAIVEPGTRPPAPEDYQYEALDQRRLRALAEGDAFVPLLIGGAATRLSLAGAQDKLPVAIMDDNIMLPLGGAPSTHILKLPHRVFKHVPANEAFVLGLAERVGLPVVKFELTRATGALSLLVERYDRLLSSDPWPASRLHQEDLCQVFGLPATKKYEEEGGPTLAKVIDTLRGHVRQPVREVLRLIEWQAFNIVAGNSDGHAKNLSVLYDEAGPRLAPFYDLLSTRHYPRLDRRLAMGVANERDPDLVTRAAWEALSRELQMTPRIVIEAARSVAERCLDVLSACKSDFRRRYGDEAILQTLPRAIAARARRAQRALTVG